MRERITAYKAGGDDSDPGASSCRATALPATALATGGDHSRPLVPPLRQRCVRQFVSLRRPQSPLASGKGGEHAPRDRWPGEKRWSTLDRVQRTANMGFRSDVV
jgi:hypothetical protein